MSKDVVERLDRLERENRRLKRWGGALIGVVGVIALSSMAWPAMCKTVWAERFVLKDAGGKGRLTMDAYMNGDPTITAQDPNGRTFARLTMSGTSPTLEFFDRHGAPTGKVGLDEEGDPYVERASDENAVSMR